MVRPAKTNPIDICFLHVKPKRHGDPDVESRKFSSVILLSRCDAIRELATDIFTAVGHAKSDCPEVWITDDGIKLLWSEATRYLHVLITYDKSVSYFVAKNKTEVPQWNAVSNLGIVEEVLFKLGRYITGSPETECGSRKGEVA